MRTKNFQMYKLDLEKAVEQEIKLPTSIHWIIEKTRECQKNIYFMLHWLHWSLCVNHNKMWKKLLKKWNYQTTLLASWETCSYVKKQQLEPDMEQWTGSKLGKEYVNAVYCHPAYLTLMQSTSFEMPGWMNHWLESRLPGEISPTLDMQMIPL